MSICGHARAGAVRCGFAALNAAVILFGAADVCSFIGENC